MQQNGSLQQPAAPTTGGAQQQQQQQHGSSQASSTFSSAPSSRVDLINVEGARILCVADIRGAISTLNALAAEHKASAIIHTGDFGFFEPSSLPTISDRTLRHLVQYSSLLTPQQRASLLATNVTSASLRSQLSAIPTVSSSSPTFGLSEFPRLLSGELRLNVPVYTVWGACEDVHVLEKMRVAPPAPISVPRDTATQRSASSFAPANHNPAIDYSIPNLTVIDEATSRCLVIGGVRLRLFGLGGAVVPHKFFDNGSGQATIAGGQGTMWTTMLQIGELVDTATKAYDAAETRVLVSHASPGREGLVSQLALALKADLTISAGLHFRYGISYNEFSTQYDAQGFTGKLEQSKKVFNDVWQSVKAQVDSDIDESQRALLDNALAVANRVPSAGTLNTGSGAPADEGAWKNMWHWNLPDAAFGSLAFDVKEGLISSELKSHGFNFAYRQSAPKATLPPQEAPIPVGAPATSTAKPDAPSATPAAAPTQPAIATTTNATAASLTKPPVAAPGAPPPNASGPRFARGPAGPNDAPGSHFNNNNRGGSHFGGPSSRGGRHASSDDRTFGGRDWRGAGPRNATQEGGESSSSSRLPREPREPREKRGERPASQQQGPKEEGAAAPTEPKQSQHSKSDSTASRKGGPGPKAGAEGGDSTATEGTTTAGGASRSVSGRGPKRNNTDRAANKEAKENAAPSAPSTGAPAGKPAKPENKDSTAAKDSDAPKSADASESAGDGAGRGGRGGRSSRSSRRGGSGGGGRGGARRGTGEGGGGDKPAAAPAAAGAAPPAPAGGSARW